jgi:hypothetical protein
MYFFVEIRKIKVLWAVVALQANVPETKPAYILKELIELY